MTAWLTQAAALKVVEVLFWLSAATSLLCFATDTYLHSLVKAYWKPLIVCIALVLIWRIPIEGQFFHGTEYEDSYVYTVAGRQIAEHFQITPTQSTLPYSINVCVVGSLVSCKQSDNYPEHLIGYPYLLSVLFKIFGYHPSVGSWANVACACFVDFLIFATCILISGDFFTAFSAALIFAITPIFAVWGLETSAEPIANGCISLTLWFCLRFTSIRSDNDDRWRVFLVWCASTATILFALTVKRENILLPIVLPITALLVRFGYKRTEPSPVHRFRWVSVIAILGFVFSLQLHLMQTQSSEMAMLHKFPLTVAELISFMPVFVSSFFVVQWYGGAIVLVIIGIIVGLREKGLALFPLFLFFGYLLLYVFHPRTYYEMRSGITDARAALRFSMSLMAVWSMLAGLGMAMTGKWLRNTRIWMNHRNSFKWAMGCTVLIIVGVSFFATSYFREDIARDEMRMRVAPSLTALQLATTERAYKTYILTLEPLILQMYANPNVDVISLRSLDDTVINEIGLNAGTADVLYLDEQIHLSPADEERYKSQLACLNQFKRTQLTGNDVFAVFEIDKGSSARLSASEPTVNGSIR